MDYSKTKWTSNVIWTQKKKTVRISFRDLGVQSVLILILLLKHSIGNSLLTGVLGSRAQATIRILLYVCMCIFYFFYEISMEEFMFRSCSVLVGWIPGKFLYQTPACLFKCNFISKHINIWYDCRVFTFTSRF